jgi:flagellin-like protein
MKSKKTKAEMGIGTLIIFIAMILVAAIAAGVLIQTAGSLQSKALLTGERSKTQVSTSLITTQIYAENGSSGNHTLKQFFQTIKLAPGSDPIKLNDTLVTMNLKDRSADLVYKGICCNNTNVATNCTALSGSENSTSGFFTGNTNKGTFTVRYLISGQGHVNDYLVRGDVVRLCMMAPRSVREDESISFLVVPKIGSPSVVETVTPTIINDAKMFIFP